MGLFSRMLEPFVTRAPFPEGYEPPQPEPPTPPAPGGVAPGYWPDPKPQPLALAATEMSEEDFNKRMELIRYHLLRRGYTTTSSVTTPNTDPWRTLNDFQFITRESRRRDSGA